MKYYMEHFGNFNEYKASYEAYLRSIGYSEEDIPELQEIIIKPPESLVMENIPVIDRGIKPLEGYIEQLNSIIKSLEQDEKIDNRRKEIMALLNAIDNERQILGTINRNQKNDGWYWGGWMYEEIAKEVGQSNIKINTFPMVTSVNDKISAEAILRRVKEIFYLNRIFVEELNSLKLKDPFYKDKLQNARKSLESSIEERQKLAEIKRLIIEKYKNKTVNQSDTENLNQNISPNSQQPKKRSYWWLLIIAGFGTYLYTKE